MQMSSARCCFWKQQMMTSGFGWLNKIPIFISDYICAGTTPFDRLAEQRRTCSWRCLSCAMMLARCSGVSGVPLGMRPAFRMVCSVAVEGAGRRACPAAAGAPPLTPVHTICEAV